MVYYCNKCGNLFDHHGAVDEIEPNEKVIRNDKECPICDKGRKVTYNEN